MCWSDFKTTGSKIHRYIGILYNGHFSTANRHHNLFSFEVRITRVLWMDTNSRIPEQSLRSGGGDQNLLVRIGYRVVNVIQMALALLMNHLFVAEGCFGLGIPVNHTISSVDQPFAIQIHKDLNHRLRKVWVHSEFGTFPITRGPKLFELFKNNSSVFMRPLPRVL